MKFEGFLRGTQYTPVPNPLFGPLLEATGITELKCTLRAMWLLHQKKGYPRFITAAELLSDRTLLIGLDGLDIPSTEAIRLGMRMGVERGTFLCLPVTRDGKQQDIFFLNDEAGRRAVATIDEGRLDIKSATMEEGVVEEAPRAKANIFTLYEENIGILTPLLGEELKDAEQNYPWPWIEEAVKIAVRDNRRSWRYIEAKLKRWAAEGKDDGESGRYPQKTPSTEDLREYLRRRGRLRQG